MDIQKTDQYYAVSPSQETSLDSIHDFKEFIGLCKEKFINFQHSNLILDFSGIININLSKILLLSQLSETHKLNNKSFVVVCEGIQFNDVPDELVVVPTIQEAIDIIEIEEIERDLGI